MVEALELGLAEESVAESAEAQAQESAVGLAEAPVEELVQERAQEQAAELAQDMVVESAVGLAEAPVEALDISVVQVGISTLVAAEQVALVESALAVVAMAVVEEVAPDMEHLLS